MIYEYNQVWIAIVFFAIIIRSVNVQFAMPMPMPYIGPMFPPPPPPPMFPMPIIVPFPVARAGSDDGGSAATSTTTTTTTTRKPDESIALPIPFPMPFQMAIPAMPAMPVMPAMPPMPPQTFCQGPSRKPKSCPTCPPCVCKPSCTPSFFSYCSPCHQKCRCKRGEDAPQPMTPGPTYALGQILGPPPLVIVPFPPMSPPRRKPKKKKTIYSSCSDESTASGSSDSDYSKKDKRKKNKFLRRNPRSSENENEIVKPMLSYISENGDIKFETKISNDDFAELLEQGDGRLKERKHQTVNVLATDEETNKPQVVVYSKVGKKEKNGRIKHKQVFLRSGISNHVLEDGKKKLIFRPADNKKISNLSVSFQIT